MPYQVDSPLAAAFGAASGFMQGQSDSKRQKRADDLEDMKLRRDADNDALNHRYTEAMIAKSEREKAIAPTMAMEAIAGPGKGRTTKQVADEYFAAAARVATGIGGAPGNQPEAKRLMDIGVAYMNADKTDATNGLTKQRTVTEAVKPAYIKAKTTESGAHTKKILQIDPEQFSRKLQSTESLARQREEAARTRQLDREGAAAILASNAQAAAWARMRSGQDFRGGQEDRRYDHDDKREVHREQFQKDQQTRSFKHQDGKKAASSDPIKSQAAILADKIKAIQKKNPGLDVHTLRNAAREDGYPSEVIDRVLPAPAALKKGQSAGFGTF